MTSIEMLPSNREAAVNSAPRLRARQTLREPTGALVGMGSRALRELRTAIGFVFGIVAFFIGAITLLICWYVYRARSKRP